MLKKFQFQQNQFKILSHSTNHSDTQNLQFISVTITAQQMLTTNVVTMIPETYEQAINSDDAEYWKAAMDADMNTLIENDT